MNIKEITADIVAAVKEQHKQLSEKRPAIECIMDVAQWTQDKKSWYRIKFAGKKYDTESDNFSELLNFTKAIKEAVKQVNALRGYQAIAHEGTIYRRYRDHVWNCISSEPVDVTDGIILYSKPSKEYKSLAKWIEKFTGVKLDAFALYSVSIFGKRGRFDSETGSKSYLCYDGQKCRRILDWIIKYRTSRDTLKVEVKDMDDYDEEDMRHSQYAETECYGVRRHYLHLEVLTPAGKVKAQNDSMYI